MSLRVCRVCALHAISAWCRNRRLLCHCGKRVRWRTHAICSSLHVAGDTHRVEQTCLEVHEGIHQNHQERIQTAHYGDFPPK